MTYSDFIDRVNDKVRIDDEWPESANVTQEQVDISWIAALAVASTLPLGALSSSDFSEAALTGGTTVYGDMERYDMPTDVFRYRNDLGIRAVDLDGFEYQLEEAIPLILLRSKAKNPLYESATLFSVELDKRRVHTLSVEKVKLHYLKEFDKPATTSAGISGDYPLEGTHAEQAASIAASHVLGELKRDTAGAQFQAIMQRQYQTHGQPPQSEPEPEQ